VGALGPDARYGISDRELTLAQLVKQLGWEPLSLASSGFTGGAAV